jgi:tRNA(Ile2) C34 agmatinyltransferase TiaS
MHYMPDAKTPVGGVYDMVMADSVARCLYGFSNAPISATISVSESSGGEKSVATTSVSDAGGWLHLAAYNFQFSNPTITAKLTQAAPVIIVAPAKTTTITCINLKNKKLTKKITAVKPVCPAGYKKV